MKKSFFAFQKLTTLIVLCAFAVPIFSNIGVAEPSKKELTEDQRITHVLNRLGFGARPGDVQRVKAVGIEKYIEQQIQGVTIADPVAESKVRDFEIFNMSTAEVFAKYPNPGALLRQLEGGRQAVAAAQKRRGDTAKSDAVTTPEAQERMTAEEQRERQRKLQELYREYDLRPARQLVPQIA